MTILTATVTKVQIGILEIDGLLLEDGSFGVGVPQICEMFDVPQHNASRDFKALLDNSLTFLKIKIDGTRITSQALFLPEFEKLVQKLDREKGNKLAQNFRDSLVGLSLTQLFSDAFGIKFEKEDRQQWLQQRQQGKAIRRTMTDSIKAWCESQGKPEKITPYIICCSDQLNLKVFGKKAKELKQERQVASSELLRDTFTEAELMQIYRIEDRVIFLVDNLGYKPTDAIKLAVDSL